MARNDLGGGGGGDFVIDHTVLHSMFFFGLAVCSAWFEENLTFDRVEGSEKKEGSVQELFVYHQNAPDPKSD